MDVNDFLGIKTVDLSSLPFGGKEFEGQFIFTDKSEIQQYVLPVLKLTAQRALDESQIQFANLGSIEQYTHHVAKELIFSLTARVANKDLGSFQHPKDWWQAVKERWAPKWFLKKYPVEYTVYTAKAFYPDIKIPDHQEYVQFYKKGVHY
jgi:hypothetical protein